MKSWILLTALLVAILPAEAAQNRIFDYQAPRSTALLNSHIKDVVAPGIYLGYRIEADGVTMKLDLMADTTELRSVALTPEGVRIEETGDLLDVVTIGASDATLNRIDVIALHHVYQAATGAPPATYVVVPGTLATNPTAPLVAVGDVKIGEVYVAAGATAINQTDVTQVAYQTSDATYLLDRANHTGQESHTAISDWTEASEDTTGAMVGANTESNISVDYNDTTGKLNFTVPDASTSVAGAVKLATNGSSSANVAVQGNDNRLSDSRVPTGTAGGDLGGTYPNPTVDNLQGDVTGPISATVVTQGPGSGFDADTVDGQHAADIIAASNPAWVWAPSTIFTGNCPNNMDAPYAVSGSGIAIVNVEIYGANGWTGVFGVKSDATPSDGGISFQYNGNLFNSIASTTFVPIIGGKIGVYGSTSAGSGTIAICTVTQLGYVPQP